MNGGFSRSDNIRFLRSSTGEAAVPIEAPRSLVPALLCPLAREPEPWTMQRIPAQSQRPLFCCVAVVLNRLSQARHRVIQAI